MNDSREQGGNLNVPFEESHFSFEKTQCEVANLTTRFLNVKENEAAF